jgi:hypothetical protein
MSLGFIVIAAWALAAFAGAFFVVRRLDHRFPAASWGSRRQLVWYVFAAIIILPAIYVLFDGAFDGQMALCCRSLKIDQRNVDLRIEN